MQPTPQPQLAPVPSQSEEPTPKRKLRRLRGSAEAQPSSQAPSSPQTDTIAGRLAIFAEELLGMAGRSPLAGMFRGLVPRLVRDLADYPEEQLGAYLDALIERLRQVRHGAPDQT